MVAAEVSNPEVNEVIDWTLAAHLTFSFLVRGGSEVRGGWHTVIHRQQHSESARPPGGMSQSWVSHCCRGQQLLLLQACYAWLTNNCYRYMAWMEMYWRAPCVWELYFTETICGIVNGLSGKVNKPRILSFPVQQSDCQWNSSERERERDWRLVGGRAVSMQ